MNSASCFFEATINIISKEKKNAFNDNKLGAPMSYVKKKKKKKRIELFF